MPPKLVKDPIYHQLNTILRERISSEEFSVGDRFPTERQVSEEYSVSRATANKSLSSLVSEGLLEFRKGVGTFVRAQVDRDEGGSLVGFTQIVTKRNMKPTTKITRFEKKAIQELHSVTGANELRLAPDEEVYLIERIRLADGVPMMLEDRLLVAKYLPGLTKKMLEGSLYDLLKSKYQLEIVGSEETIEAVTVNAEQSKLLGVATGKAGFLVRSVGYMAQDIPLWIESTLHKPDGFEFRCRSKRVPHELNMHRRVILSSEFNLEKPA